VGAAGATSLTKPQLVTIGIVCGLLSGLLGVGGGVIMVPMLVLWVGIAQRDAHAISLGAIIPISAAGILAFAVAGEIEVLPALLLAAGSVLGARVGAGVLARMDERGLQRAFGVFLVLVAAVMAVRG
jgi:uncharacterized membrane protein YfcA